MKTGMPGHNRKQPEKTKRERALCVNCGKPVNEPKGCHRVLVFGVGWFHKRCAPS